MLGLRSISFSVVDLATAGLGHSQGTSLEIVVVVVVELVFELGSKG
jgi:hypothetical protein